MALGWKVTVGVSMMKFHCCREVARWQSPAANLGEARMSRVVEVVASREGSQESRYLSIAVQDPSLKILSWLRLCSYSVGGLAKVVHFAMDRWEKLIIR